MEKPPLDGVQLANTGAYVFPPDVFGDIELSLSARGEFEITDYVSSLAAHAAWRCKWCGRSSGCRLATSRRWQAAQAVDLDEVVLAGGKAVKAFAGASPRSKAILSPGNDVDGQDPWR